LNTIARQQTEQYDAERIDKLCHSHIPEKIIP
jgi:hypothetical protein